MDLNHLPGDLVQFVQQEVAAGRFASVEEVVSAALRLLQGREAGGGNGPATPTVAKKPGSQALPDDVEHTPEDMIRAIKQAFELDSPEQAERLAQEGAHRYPEHDALQRYACVLAPPTVKRAPSTAASRAAAKADQTWLNTHWEDYRGNWIALQAGELLHATPSLDDLIAHVGDVQGRNILVTKLN
jgi:Arc/MetJ-type ribon-helix-helix transcriptional regulator